MGIIKISSNGEVQTVNARELQAFLESRRQFADWIKERIDQYGFVEGRDFTVHKSVNGRATVIDYYLTLDMAKELAMLERNDKGKRARQYFIDCERQAKATDPIKILNDPAAMRGLLLTYSEKVLAMESKVSTHDPGISTRQARQPDGSSAALGRSLLRRYCVDVLAHPAPDFHSDQSRLLGWLV